MKIGIRYSDTALDHIVAVAQSADDNGLESLWRGEHILTPRVIKSIDPYYARALPPGMERFAMIEPITLASFLSAKTRRIKFSTGITIAALHVPAQLARVVATADIVSDGRMMLAVGIGWLKEEYDILGVDWKTRGSRTDEAIQVVRTLWCDQHPQFQGRHFTLPPVTFQPKPVQKPSPPIFVAGLSPAAIRRAVRFGDGWYGHDLTVAEAKTIIDRIHSEREKSENLDKPFEITTRAPWDISIAEFDRFRAIGVDRLVLDVGSAFNDGLSEVLTRLERIGRDIVDAG